MGTYLRITSGGRARAAAEAMNEGLANLAKAQRLLTTGKRIERASDDPSGALSLMRLDSQIDDIGQYSRNADQAKSFLNLTDSALDSVNTLVRQARSITVQAANGTNSGLQTREALADQIGLIKTQIIGLANTSLNGRYLFAGQRTDTPAYDPTGASNAYQGDSSSMQIEVGPGEYVSMNVSGDSIFTDTLSALDDIVSHINSGDLNALSATDLDNMDDAVGRVVTKRGSVGAAINRIDDTKLRLDAFKETIVSLKTTTEDVDLTQAYIELQKAQNAYQASLASTAKTFEISLMDYLR